MNRRLIKIFNYIKMSLLFTATGSLVLYFAGAPLISYIVSQGNMIIVKGAPDHFEDSNSGLSKQEVSTAGILDQSGIQKPDLKTKYGRLSVTE
jgi:hypothetical protein